MPAVPCAKCKRPINATFDRCPFCKTDVKPAATGTPVAAAQPAADVRVLPCPSCRRPINASFAACPFCKSSVARAGVAAPLTRDYAMIAEKSLTAFAPHWVFDYSAASVMQLDTFLMSQFGPDARGPAEGDWDPGPQHAGLLVGLGILFGEIVRRTFDGAWSEAIEPDNPLAAGILLPSGETVFAVARPYKRVRFGSVSALWPMWLDLHARHPARPDPKEANAFLRVAGHLESRGHGLAAMPFVQHALKLNLPPMQRMVAIELHTKLMVRARDEMRRGEGARDDRDA